MLVGERAIEREEKELKSKNEQSRDRVCACERVRRGIEEPFEACVRRED